MSFCGPHNSSAVASVSHYAFNRGQLHENSCKLIPLKRIGPPCTTPENLKRDELRLLGNAFYVTSYDPFFSRDYLPNNRADDSNEKCIAKRTLDGSWGINVRPQYRVLFSLKLARKDASKSTVERNRSAPRVSCKYRRFCVDTEAHATAEFDFLVNGRKIL